MKKYKAIFSDYDGTLAGSDFKISQVVKDAVKKWRNSGKFFTIITSKPFVGPIKNTCEELELTDPVVLLGGAEIINPKTGEVIDIQALSSGEVDQIIKELRKSDFAYELNDHEYVYSPRFEELQKIFLHKKYKSFEDFSSQEILKVRIITTGRSDKEIGSTIEALKDKFKDLHVIEGRTAYATGIDITSQKANKYLATLRLCEILNINPKDVIGIGDGPIDYPLLAASGYKVAMGGSPKELTDIADYVTSDFKHDGLANLINKILTNP